MPDLQDNRILVIATAALIGLAFFAKPFLIPLRLKRAPRFILRSGDIAVHISALGGIIQRLFVPDRNGKVADVVLGHDSLTDYLEFNQYFGAVIGRVANRTAYGMFTADGQEYKLTANDGPHHLHGGSKGWDKVIWQGNQFQHKDGEAVKLTYRSSDGEQGYPGNVEASITYILQANGTLRTIFEASTDKTTPINMAQHSYFNLSGHSSGTVLGHKLQINGSHYTPKDSSGIPTGEINAVQGTPFDFSDSTVVGDRINEVEGGYDHNYVLFGKGKNAKFSTDLGIASQQPKLAAELEDPQSGRVMKVLTTAPGLQLYTGNFIENVRGKEGVTYQKHAGLCLETQGFPNALNEAAFPIALFRPGEKYHHEVVYQFSSK